MQFFRLRARNNEDFVWTLPTISLQSGAVVKMQLRQVGADPSAPAALSFASDSSQTGTITLDVTNQALYFFAPQSAVAALSGYYLFDVVIIQGGQRNVAAVGSLLMLAGETTI